MKQRIQYHCAAILLLCCVGGCVSTTVVTTPEQFAEINALGQDNRATVTLHGDSVDRSTVAGKLSITQDSLHWFDPQSYQPQTALTANLQRIRFVNRGSGAIEGAAIGAIPGAVIFSLVAIGTAVNGTGEFTDDFMIIGGAVAGSGAIIGAIVGALIGHKNDYVFAEAPAQKIKFPNALYIELGTFLIFVQSSLSVNYERAILPHLSLRAGVATCWSDGNANRLSAQVMALYFTSAEDSKFELGAGLSAGQKQDVGMGSFSTFAPAISIGYRYQPADGGIMFRMGGAWTYGNGWPFQISLGYNF